MKKKTLIWIALRSYFINHEQHVSKSCIVSYIIIVWKMFIVEMMKTINQHHWQTIKQEANGWKMDGKLKWLKWLVWRKKKMWKKRIALLNFFVFQIRIKICYKKNRFRRNQQYSYILRVMMIFFSSSFYLCFVLFSILQQWTQSLFFNNRRECDVSRQKITCKVFFIIDKTRFKWMARVNVCFEPNSCLNGGKKEKIE